MPRSPRHTQRFDRFWRAARKLGAQEVVQCSRSNSEATNGIVVLTSVGSRRRSAEQSLNTPSAAKRTKHNDCTAETNRDHHDTMPIPMPMPMYSNAMRRTSVGSSDEQINLSGGSSSSCVCVVEPTPRSAHCVCFFKNGNLCLYPVAITMMSTSTVSPEDCDKHIQNG